MIITRTPLRISFVGGGSDLESFYKASEGSVISTSIDKYIYISVHPLFNNPRGYFLKYSKSEKVNNVNEINHPIIKSVLGRYGISGVDINSSADIPSGTGLGSSSAFTAGLIKACCSLVNHRKSNYNIAEEACDIEINELKEPIGKQDQYACANGGFNQIFFKKNGNVLIDPIQFQNGALEELEDNLFLYYTGMTRSASSILKEQKKNTEGDKFKIMEEMVKLTSPLRKCLETGKFDDIGPIMNHAWNLKKQMASNVSNSQIDDIYHFGLKSGATGGKLLGAGGGGFTLFYCPSKFQNKFLKKMNENFKLIPFKSEFNGATLIKF